ncbi:arginine N-succinyltransferase [bacterium]|nr:arginine N-succinyltransferase [bacterium]
MISDYVVRPASLDDLDAIERLAYEAKLGMTSLPRDRSALHKKLSHSMTSFGEVITSPNGELYFFVLEHALTQTVVGTCKLKSRIGVNDPSMSFQIETLRRYSPQLDQVVESTLLHPKIEFAGPTEVGGLFVSEAHREKGLGRLLSLSRFMFLAMHRERFSNEAMAEMRGVITEDGNSPFWDAVGAHIFGIDFHQADYLAAVDRTFIRDLLPHFPIYVDLLPVGARNVIGTTHRDTEPAMRLLQHEGFAMTRLIDVFDAGPKVACPVSEIRTVRDARYAPVGAIISEMDHHLVEGNHGDEPLFLISNGKLNEFRCSVGYLDVDGDAVNLPRHYSNLLNLTIEDMVWFSPMFPNSFLRRFAKWYSKVPITSGDVGSSEKANRLNR